MYFGQIIKADSANGTGIRLSLFVSGCTNRCPGCFQPATWDFKFGRPFTKEVEDSIIEELKKPYYEGLTILGGEPFEIENQETVLHLILRVKKEVPNRNIWMYSGFIYDTELSYGGCRHTEFTDEILDNIDILVDGRFMIKLLDITLNFRGSSNQRIIDMRKSRKEGKVILSPLNDKKNA